MAEKNEMPLNSSPNNTTASNVNEKDDESFSKDMQKLERVKTPMTGVENEFLGVYFLFCNFIKNVLMLNLS